MKSTKKSLLASGVSLLLSAALLVGSTFAWFTDSVTNTGNRVEAGTLKVDLLMDKGDGKGYQSIDEGSGDIFNEAEGGNGYNWEPGMTQVVYLAVENQGTLSLKYNIRLDILEDGLAEALQFVVVDGAQYGAVKSWDEIKSDANVVADYIVDGQISAAPQGHLSAGKTEYFALAVHMAESAGNDYQNSSFAMDVKVIAGQYTEEKDGFGNSDYDKDAPYETGDGNFSGGFGTVESPYLVSTKEDLLNIGYKGFGEEDGEDYFYNRVFQLTQDIDMEDEPIKNLGSFRGLLDGNGYSLKNVNFTSEGEGLGNNVGLFSGLNGATTAKFTKQQPPRSWQAPIAMRSTAKIILLPVVR